MNEATGSELPKDLATQEFERFRDYLSKHSGIYMEDTKRDSLRISLVARASRLRCADFDEYFRVLVSSEDEFKELLNLVTINETSFFRFPAQFDALRNQVLPEIMRTSTGDRTLRVWSAGCSTGEEPYSLAITLADMAIEGLGFRPQVVGTDVSTAALNTARAGIYPAKSLLTVPPDVVTRHFDEVEGGYRVRRSTRGLVEFGYHNLIKEPYPLAFMGAWDVIFCRNVTIYFSLDSTRRVVSNFFKMLNPGGYLFVGHSETLTNISEEFEAVEVDGVFLYRKPRTPASPQARPDTIRKRVQPPSSRSASAPKATRRQPSTVAPTSKTARPARSDEAADPLEQARKYAAAGEPARVLQLVAPLRESRATAAEAHLLAAHAHADLGEYDEARAACNQALAIDPLLAAARYILGVIQQREGDVAGAISELKKTIYIDADFAIAHLNLANLYKAQRQFTAACRSYENALRALYANPEGDWVGFMGGFKADLLVKTVERSLLECRKAAGNG